jgi:release factor glutamine methyltransferase
LPLPFRRHRYLPAEDTDLVREALEHFSGDSCLEIGFGSGAVLASVSGRFRFSVGTDIVALEEARLALHARVELVLADMARCFRDGVFDVVFFNPPYLPSETIEDQAVDGGPTGVEVPVSFLEEGLRVLREGGVVVALLSTEGDVGSFLAHCSSLGLQVEPIAEKRLFYETLSVYRIQKKGDMSTRQS